ncbi:hypothetical protein SAMN07250955_10864 [Arboricoccus pini]|uniref:Uncharacterized protein n=1 Tax=Arboricoccus pini TaxID=1963835 RepID=A0A212RFK9_9PROT|nr:hypothetical protein [Arboricoccus pini]SNB71137.1 hypothetical protein SAMN07250955_10864 [Arboricoccus pini]
MNASFSRTREHFTAWAAGPRNHVQDRHIYTINGELCVDAVIRFEQRDSDIRKVADRCGIAEFLGPMPSFKREYRQRPEPFIGYYDRSTADIIRSAFAWEMRTFEYR